VGLFRNTLGVAIFARVSTDHQSYERQIADLTQYAKSRNLEVIEIITEKISGAKDNSEREGIIQLRALANQGKFDRILVTELSRLGRNAYQVATLIHEFTELGISIIVQSLGVETLSDEGKANPLIDLLIAVVNQFSSMERTFLIDRINSGLDRARANRDHLHLLLIVSSFFKARFDSSRSYS
jgi:DNA invertase Pin-like site-specific DNA recombinase